MPRHRLFVVVIAGLLSILEGRCAAQQAFPAAYQHLVEQLEKTAIDITKDPKAASITIGLVDKHGIVWAKSYGYANLTHRIPANTDSVYRIGSITKQFTALMLLQLVHQGKVRFSDPVEKYFP